MVVQTDRRVLWHPRLDSRFLVGSSSQVTVYEWVPDSSEIKHTTSYHGQDATSMKCLAWSPDPAYDDLIAAGLSNGRVDIVRLEATRSAKGATTTGQTLARPIAPLSVRMSRACNALAFCTADPNYLAVGLDKVRGDASLVVWDVNATMPAVSASVKPSTQLSFNVPTSTAGRPQPAIARGDSLAPKSDPRVLQSHAATEVVSSVAFLPQTTTMLLAGISHRWLRLFDLRTPSPQVLTAASKVHGIATDTFDPHRICCFGDGIATIWDARRFTHPLLTFTEKDASADGARYKTNSTLLHVEFSTVRRGVLATLERDSNHVRFWDLQQFDLIDRSPERSHSRDSTQSYRAPRLSWANPTNMLNWSSTANANAAMAPSENVRGQNQIVLSDTRRTKYFSKPVSNFALLPSPKSTPLTSNVMVVTKEGDLELYAVHDTPTHTPWSARGDLTMGIGTSYKVIPGLHESEPPPEPWELTAQTYPHSTPHSVAKPLHDDFPPRGRAPPPTALFGRGDEDGFPALKGAANLAATRPGASRGYSPAALRTRRFEHTALPKRVMSMSSPARGEASLKSKTRSQSRRQKDTSPSRGHADGALQHVVEGDVSMTMRKRVVKGYGLVNPLHNSSIVLEAGSDHTLSQLWMWIDHSQRLLSVSPTLLDGYNFSYQGILGIWEGFPPSRPRITVPHPTPRMRSLLLDMPQTSISNLIADARQSRSRSRQPEPPRHTRPVDANQEEFAFVVSTLLNENDRDRSTWKPGVATSKLVQRQLALDLCGWSLAEEDLATAVKRWEKENKHSQAACWLVFTKNHRAAVDLLMRSKDESHHMMSGMLAAFSPSSGSGLKNSELRDHCERLIVRLQDPYLRAMLTHLTVSDDWTEVLQEDALPLRERLAIAFQFLTDKELSTYLRRVVEQSARDGDIEGLIVTGLTPQGFDILQTYLDTTGDVQTAAILASLNASRAQDRRADRWLDAYRDLLDGWKLFHYRCQLDIDRGRILNDAIQQGELPSSKWAPPQIIIKCNYCNKSLQPPWPNNAKPTACFHCGRSLPRCSICLMTLSIPQDSARNAELIHSQPKDTIAEALVFCQTCRHGGHSSHILEWFFGDDTRRSHEVCPVASCECRCADGM